MAAQTRMIMERVKRSTDTDLLNLVMERAQRRGYIDDVRRVDLSRYLGFANIERRDGLGFFECLERNRRTVSDRVTAFHFECVAETRNVACPWSSQPNIIWAEGKSLSVEA
jgi:hypothetical protein